MISKRISNSVFILSLSLIAIISLLFRLKGLVDNPPFWVDEFSTAHQARHVLQYGIDVFKSVNIPPIYFEDRNITTHFLVAVFFSVFGEKEWVARLPIALIGSLVPGLLMLLARRIFDVRTAILAGILTAFSYYEIAWSRQARGYMIQQFLTILTIYFYIKLTDRKKVHFSDIVLLSASIVLGILTHPLFLLLVFCLLVHYLLTKNREEILTLFKRAYTYIVVLSLALILFKLGVFQSVLSNIGKVNNVWYYHSFLWREYGLLTFLAVLGLYSAIVLKKRFILPIALFLVINIVYLCFLLGPYTSRYLNPIFPFILLFSAYFITSSLDQMKKPRLLHIMAPFLFALFLIVNGHKFDLKPNSFYSINHDFREVAIINYHQVYDLIKRKGDLRSGQTVVIETWPDRASWYLGQDFVHLSLLHWKKSGVINGIATGITPFILNKAGEKVSKAYPTMGYISELSDLRLTMKRYPRGFLFIDDASMPEDVIEYAENNFKKEIYLDHYPLDDNPYSIWPATLYSWGIK